MESKNLVPIGVPDGQTMKKCERYAFKLTHADKQGLFLLAQAEGEQVAVVLRRLIRRELASRDIIVDLEMKSSDERKWIIRSNPTSAS